MPNLIGTTVTVDIASTVGQASAIAANGSSTFKVEVTTEPVVYMNEVTGEIDCELIGFGTVLEGPVKGYDVGFHTAGVQA